MQNSDRSPSSSAALAAETQPNSALDTTRIERNRRLIEQAQAGDEGAMEALVVENAGLVRSLAQRFLGR